MLRGAGSEGGRLGRREAPSEVLLHQAHALGIVCAV